MENEPTEADIAFLRSNPHAASQFENRFGAGTATAILEPTTPAPSGVSSGEFEDAYGDLQAAAQPLSGATAERFGEVAHTSATPGWVDVAADVGRGAVHGVQEALNETVDTLESADLAMSQQLEEFGIPSRLQITNQDGEFDPRLKTLAESEGDSDWLGGETTVQGDAAEIEVIREPVTAMGRFTSSTTQFLAGYAGASRVTGLKGLFGAAVNGAFADGIVFDPEDPNLTAFAAQNEYALPLISEALATDPDDPEWMNRVRNVAEGVVLGGAVDLTLRGLRGLSLGAKGNRLGDESLVRQGEDLVDEVAEEAQQAMNEGIPLDGPEPLLLGPESRLDQPTRDNLVNEDALRAAIGDQELVTPEQIANSNWFNAERMDGPVDAQIMIEVAGDALARSGALERLGLDVPETFDTVVRGATEELASLTGGSVGQLTDRMASLGEVAVDQARFVVAGKMALQSIGQQAANVARQLDGMTTVGKVDPEVEARFLDLMTTHANLQGHLKQVQTAAARATSAGRIATGPGLDDAAMSALDRVTQAGGSDAVRRAAAQLRLAEGPHQQASLIRSMNRGTVGQRALKVINEVFINNILSGWKTHAVNVTSNTLNTVVLPAERVMGGLLTGRIGEARAGLEQYAAIRSSMMDSVRLSARVLRNEMPVLDTQVKLDNQAEGYRAVSSAALGMNQGRGANLVNAMGAAIRMPGRFLMAEDEFFKQIMFRSRLQGRLNVDASSMTQADFTRLGYRDAGEFIQGEIDNATMSVQSLSDAFDDLVQKGRVVDDPEARQTYINDNLGAANESSQYGIDALRVAREGTFTAPLEEGTLSHGWQNLSNRHPLLRQITPFIQTPVNILNKSFDRVPGVNLLRSRYRDRLRSSDPSVRAEAAGEMATGVALSTTLYMLAIEGRITGGGPTDPGRREMWMRDSNWQPYSLNMGTSEEPNWIEFKRMDPYAFSFGIAGDIAEMIQAAQSDPSMDTTGMIALLIASVGNNITSKTWLQGVSDTIEVLESKDRPYVAQRWLENRAAAMVPFSSAGRTYNQAQDGYMQDTRGYIDRIRSVTPGMSDALATRHDWVNGEPIENPTRLLGFITQREGQNNAVSVEMRRLNYGFSGPDRRIGEITLSTEQYQTWNRLMGSVQIGGRSLETQLQRVMDTERYDLARERVPDGIVAPSESHRVEMLRGVVTAYKQKARASLFEEYPELQEAWVAYERYEAEAQAGRANAGDRENLLLEF